MKEQLVSLETAKLAKEKGFNIKCVNYYNYNDGTLNFIATTTEELLYAPTQSLLQKWLREKHSIIVWANPIYYDGWHYLTEGYLPNGRSIDCKEDYNDEIYEEAIEVGLRKALTYIK